MVADLSAIGMIDPCQKTPHKPLTDLEKWKKHLDEMNIKYEERQDCLNNIELVISHESYFDNDHQSRLYIIFHINGKFKQFEPVN